MSGEVLSIEDYVAQGFTRVQAIKKHYEALKENGAPATTTAAAETSRTNLQIRYDELQKISDQKGFVKTAIRSVNVERRLSQRMDSINFDEAAEDSPKSNDSNSIGNNSQQSKSKSKSSKNSSPVTVEVNSKSDPPPSTSITFAASVEPSSVNHSSSTRSVDSRLFQALEEVESRSGLTKVSFSYSVGDTLADDLDDVGDDLDDYEDDEDDPFPHFLDTATVEASEDFVSPNIKLQSSEPTMDNITSFIHQSDYSGDEIKEFHFLIEQGFNIDEASDLVYQRRLNRLPSVNLPISGVPSLSPPPYDMPLSGNHSSNNNSNAGGSSSPSPGSPTPVSTTPPPPSYNAAMAMSPSYPAISVQVVPPQPAMQHPPSYSQRSGHMPGHMLMHDSMHQSPSHHQQFAPVPQQQQQPQPHQSSQPLQIKRIPLRANALSGNKEADLQQLLERGYTYEQASEICEIIYADQQRLESGEQQRQGNAGMSVAGSSMSSGLKKKRSGRKPSKRNLVPDLEAVKLAMLVSEQEAEFGLNMYDSLQPEDEDIIAEFMSHGYSLDEAVFEVFTNKMSGLNNNNSSKQRQVSGNGTTSGVLRVIVPSTTATNVIGPPMSSSPATGRNLLVPLRDTSGSRDSPTMQMAGVNGGGGASNPNRNSFGGPSTPGSQPNSSRMSQPVRIPANNAMMSPGIQQSFMPPQGSPSNNAGGGGMHAMMRKGGISTPPAQPQIFPSPGPGAAGAGSYVDDHHGSGDLVGDMDEAMMMNMMMMGVDGMMLPPVGISGIPEDFDVDYTAAKNIENEIELLMMTGYTRESAVRYLLERAKRETPAISMPTGMPRSRMNSGVRMGVPPPGMEEDMQLPVPTEIQIQMKDSDHMTVTSDLTGSVIMSVASSQRNKLGRNDGGGFGDFMSRDLPPPPSSQLKYYGNDGLYQSIPGGGGYGGPGGIFNGSNNANNNNNMHHPHLMHQIDEEEEEDDNYDDYNENAAIDLKHMYPYMNYEDIYNRQPHRNIFSLPEEERALKVGILISQQSATFDTNMYESITPEDEPMINSLLALGFDEDETYLIIFERKFGPPGIGERSVRSVPTQHHNSVRVWL
jgi:hypothetical protein